MYLSSHIGSGFKLAISTARGQFLKQSLVQSKRIVVDYVTIVNSNPFID